MKKLILFLFVLISGFVNAQFDIVPIIDPVNPTFNSVNTSGTYNYNRNYLKDWDAQIAKIQQATSNSTASVVWIGDSWTMNGNIVQPICSYLRTKFGDAGVGYFGAGTGNLGNTSGSAGQSATITRVGSWVNVSQNTYVRSVAIGADSSSTLNDSIYYVGRVTDVIIHYMKKTSGGSFVTRVDGTSPTTISTSGTTGLNFSSITGLTDGTHTISIKVSSTGSGVLICGAELNKSQNGVRIHNLGASGSTATEWLRQDSTNWATGIQQLAPNMAVICLGVNDCAANKTTTEYIGYITRMVNRIKAAKPNISIVLFSPSDIGLVTTYPMSSYVSVLKTYALANNYGFIDNYSLIGDYTTANARGLYTNTSHVNSVGGNVMIQNFLNFLMNGQSMYYSSGNNFNIGENSLISANSIGIGNTAIGTQVLQATTTGTSNTGTGYQSLFSNITGVGNSSYGYKALRANTASGNSAFGEYALNLNTSGSDNSAFGKFAAFNTSTAIAISAFGSGALQLNTTGDYNSGFGSLVGFSNTSGSRNTYVGYAAGYSNQTGAQNTAAGMFALYNSTVSNNTALGYYCGGSLTSGSGNILLGWRCGFYLTTQKNRIILNSIDRSSVAGDTANSPIYVYEHATVSSQRIYLNGNLYTKHLIGNTTSPTCTLGTGAGTGATYTLATNSTDVAGQISITAAGTPASNATVATITFNTAYSVAPIVILTPGNSNAASLSTTTQVYATSTTTTFLIKSNSTGIATGDYAWNWHIIQ